MSTAHKKVIQRYYSKRARNYDRQKARTGKSQLGFEAKILKETVNAVSWVKEGLILEVGVGSGRVALPLLKETSSQFIGLDLSKEMLQIARTKMSAYKRRFNFMMGDAEHLPFHDNVFDAVICTSMLHYLFSSEISLKEFSRTIKREGIFLYGDVTMHEKDHRGFLDRLERAISIAHAKYCKPSEMKRLLENCGIHVSKMEVFPYKKPYTALFEDKARYFNVKPRNLTEKVREATEKERNLYRIEENQMTLFYTLIKGVKRNQT